MGKKLGDRRGHSGYGEYLDTACIQMFEFFCACYILSWCFGMAGVLETISHQSGFLEPELVIL